MTRLLIPLVISLAFAFELIAQKPPQNYTGTATIQKTPEMQIAYARALYSKSLGLPHGPSRKQAFVDAITALEAVPYTWPKDKNAVGTALLLEAQYFFGADAYPNVLKVLDRAVDPLKGTPEETWMWDWRGRALDRLNLRDQADDAYKHAKALSHRLDDGRKSAILRDAAFFHARGGRFQEAADEYREVSHLRAESAWSALTPMMMSLEANLHLPDKARARQDLHDLETLINKAHEENLAPGNREGLAQAEQTLLWYKKRLQ